MGEELTVKIPTDNYQRRFDALLDPGVYRDGDSFWALIDFGWGVQARHELRLVGLNAPEARATGGREATRALEEWLTAHRTHVQPGENRAWPFRLRSPGRDAEKYGRWLADVTCGLGHSLNAWMLTIEGVVPMEG
jgi:endonuclease YncB( thermonuclease family)